MKSKLYVVATPIGNLQDITLRALETLKRVNFIACEDTRNTRKLLTYYGIEKKRLISYHDYNEEKVSTKIFKILDKEDVALVSDAGTPCISDPGYRIVNLCRRNGVEVVPIPGPFAAAVALSASGLPTDKFLFVGFLSQKDTKRGQQLRDYIELGYTFIIYESPKRVLETVREIQNIDRDADVVIAKELTKVHEKFIHGKVNEVLIYLERELDLLKGEFVIIVTPSGVEKSVDVDDDILNLLNTGKTVKEIATTLSEKFNIPKNRVYKRVLEIKGQP